MGWMLWRRPDTAVQTVAVPAVQQLGPVFVADRTLRLQRHPMWRPYSLGNESPSRFGGLLWAIMPELFNSSSKMVVCLADGMGGVSGFLASTLVDSYVYFSSLTRDMADPADTSMARALANLAGGNTVVNSLLSTAGVGDLSSAVAVGWLIGDIQALLRESLRPYPTLVTCDIDALDCAPSLTSQEAYSSALVGTCRLYLCVGGPRTKLVLKVSMTYLRALTRTIAELWEYCADVRVYRCYASSESAPEVYVVATGVTHTQHYPLLRLRAVKDLGPASVDTVEAVWREEVERLEEEVRMERVPWVPRPQASRAYHELFRPVCDLAAASWAHKTHHLLINWEIETLIHAYQAGIPVATALTRLQTAIQKRLEQYQTHDAEHGREVIWARHVNLHTRAHRVEVARKMMSLQGCQWFLDSLRGLGPGAYPQISEVWSWDGYQQALRTTPSPYRELRWNPWDDNQRTPRWSPIAVAVISAPDAPYEAFLEGLRFGLSIMAAVQN